MLLFPKPPPTRELLETIMPMYVEVDVYRAALESTASEFGARMTAMEAATKNTEDLIDQLTLDFNRARQAAITSEFAPFWISSLICWTPSSPHRNG